MVERVVICGAYLHDNEKIHAEDGRGEESAWQLCAGDKILIQVIPRYLISDYECDNHSGDDQSARPKDEYTDVCVFVPKGAQTFGPT